jgi:hypothetical protein
MPKVPTKRISSGIPGKIATFYCSNISYDVVTSNSMVVDLILHKTRLSQGRI